MDWELFVVALCILISFLFSAAETTLTSLGRLEVQSLIASERVKARLLQSWVRDPSRMLTIVLVGNNISNIVSSSVLALWADKKFPNHVSLVITAFTLVLIVFSEIVPKLLARNIATVAAPYALNFLQVVGFVLWPVIFVFQKVSSGVVLLSGMTGRGHHKPIGEEELNHTIEIATKDGGIDRETGAVLSNLIDFPDHIARDIMTPRSKMKALSIKWTHDEVLRFIASDGHSRYPVIRESLDQLVGVVLVKDLIAVIHKEQGSAWTRVVRKPYFISEVAPLGTVLRDMKRWGTHLALVRNESGVLTGLVTLEDLLEEIVGEIRDEHDDPAEAGSEAMMGGPRLVSGEIPIVDFNEVYDASLPMDGSYSTLNGYVLSKLGGQLPPVGTLIFTEDLTFRVHSVEEAGIVTLEIISPTRVGFDH